MLSFVVVIVLQQTSTSLWKCESCKVEIENFATTIQNKVKCYSNNVGSLFRMCLPRGSTQSIKGFSPIRMKGGPTQYEQHSKSKQNL